MTRITLGQKLYFAAVGLLALWVGSWGYFIPSRVDQAIPWLVPPLHARFLGAMYLSGVAFMIGAILSRFHAEVRITIRMIVIWTGMLFIVSLFYLGEFDYTHPPVWFWFGAYLIYPLIGLQLILKYRTLQEKSKRTRFTGLGKRLFFGAGCGDDLIGRLPFDCAAVHGKCLALENYCVARSNVFSSISVLWIRELTLSRQQMWMEARVAVIGIFVFTFGVFLASLIHRELFSITNMAVWVWFGSFLLATVTLGES